MKKKFYLIGALFMALVTAQAQSQDERINHIIKEKFHLDKFQEIRPADGTLKTTANMEHKLSNVVSSSIQEAEGFIAINPTDSNKMVLSYMDFSTTLIFPVYYTTDGGLTWTKSAFNSTNIVSQDLPNGIIAGGGDPVFAYDDSGKLYFSFLYLVVNSQSGVGDFVMYWATSSNDGQTFAFESGDDHFVGKGAIDLFTGGVADSVGDGIYDRQWMAVDNSGGTFDGRLYLSTLFIPNAQTNLNGNGTILMYKDADSTKFSSNQIQVSNVPDAQFGNVVVDGNGHVHVTFADFANNILYHRKSTNGGQTFGNLNTVYQGFGMFGGMPYVVHGRENAAPTLVVDPNNTLHLAWADYNNDTAFAFYSRSTNGGSTWSTPLNLGVKVPGFKDNLMPHVAVDNNGNPSVSWYAVKPNGKSMFYNIQSKDGGATFYPPATVSTDSTDYTQYNQNNFFGDYCNSVKTGCKTFTLWSDGRQNLGPKMYVGTVDHCASVGFTELTPIDSKLKLGSLFPNPVTNFVTLSLNSQEAFNASITIYSIDGKQMNQHHVDVQAGEQDIRLDLNLASGTYLLQITTPDNGMIVRKLTVQ